MIINVCVGEAHTQRAHTHREDKEDSEELQRAAEQAWQKIVAMRSILKDVLAEKCMLPQAEVTFKNAFDLGLTFSSAIHEIYLNWRADECTRTSQWRSSSDMFSKSVLEKNKRLTLEQYHCVHRS